MTDGHTLVVPRQHVSSIYQLSAAEQTALWDLVAGVRQSILNKLKPDGLNVGVNDGLAAGQTIEYAHVHVIPITRAMCPIREVASGAGAVVGASIPP